MSLQTAKRPRVFFSYLFFTRYRALRVFRVFRVLKAVKQLQMVDGAQQLFVLLSTLMR